MINNEVPMLKRNPSAVNVTLASACVGIAGCGGLGSNVAVALVRSGVGQLVVADSDVVEESNLNRQHFFRRHLGMSKVDALKDVIADIRPEVNVEMYCCHVDADTVFGLFRSCSILIEAFDTVESKAMLMRSFTDERFADKILISASGLAGYGPSDSIRTEKIGERIYVCGDQCSKVEKEGVMAPRVLITAAHQANLALRLLCGVEDV